MSPLPYAFAHAKLVLRMHHDRYHCVCVCVMSLVHNDVGNENCSDVASPVGMNGCPP